MSSSRLIVKNLPRTATENKLKETFSVKGTVTDVQLKFAEDGKFRGFAFVGFKTKEEADIARDYFDKTFFGATKIQVESCVGLADRPKAWSKHAKGRDNTQEKEHARKREIVDEEGDSKPKRKKRKEEEVLEKCKDDPMFREFLEIHRKDQAKWGNDTILDELEKLTHSNEKTSKKKKKINTPVEEVEEGDNENDKAETAAAETEVVETRKEKNKGDKSSEHKKDKREKVMPDKEYFTIKLRDVPKKARKKDIKAFFAPLVPNSVRMPPNIRGIAYVGFLNEKDQIKALIKNKSFLLGNQVGVKKFVSNSEVEKVVQQKKSKWGAQEKELEKGSESVLETGRIFVRNLAYTTTEDDIRTVFEQYGPVTEVHLPIDKISRQIKGFAFVSFLLPDQAAKAFSALDGTVFQGRMLHLLPSKNKDELTADQMTAGSSYKKEKELKMKKTAGSSHNWNALFLGTNAVSEVVAGKYGVSREQLLLDNNDEKDDRLSSVAVRMALAETEIVSDTQKFLEDNGVCLDAFGSADKKAERSKTAFLVKNLVANTTYEELRDIFQKHGVISRIVLPPVGVTAIIEFENPAEGRAAFKKLAYTNFKGMPLYLEWAPIGVFQVSADGKRVPVVPKVTIDEGEDKTKTVDSSKQIVSSKIQLPTEDIDDEPFDEDMVPEPDTTLFVKSLNFNTEEEALKKHFSSSGRVYAVTVARKKDPKDTTKLLSQGYGFVQYYRAKDATKALERLHDSMLDNQFLEIKRSNRTLLTDATGDKSKERNGTKILVRNVPFQANDDEIMHLFQVFGKIKGIRLPKKHVGESEHRGFAFVEFFSDKHAKVAFDTLGKSTHLYGRRLVLEWAQGDETVEELREKVAKRYNLQRAGEKDSDTTSTKKKLQRYFEAESSRPKEAEDAEDDD